MSEDALAHQANDAAQQNAGGDRNGRSANAGADAAWKWFAKVDSSSTRQ